MFDIQEYYSEGRVRENGERIFSIEEVEEDISQDIDILLKNRFGRLYLTDRYKRLGRTIDIIYPALNYPEKRSLIMTADKVRFQLSLYPEKDHLENIDRVVLRPRFVEINSIELSSLYIRKDRILVLYLTHPHMYGRLQSAGTSASEFISVELQNLSVAGRLQQARSGIHPLWHYISLIAGNDSGAAIDKFFIRKTPVNDADYRSLLDISYFFSRHGY
jgi:hypothetical protein